MSHQRHSVIFSLNTVYIHKWQRNETGKIEDVSRIVMM